MKSETATGIWRKQCTERFLAYSHPLAWGFCPTQEYSWNLGSTFFDSLDKAICLKPEERLDHLKDPSARLEQYFIYETNRFFADAEYYLAHNEPIFHLLQTEVGITCFSEEFPWI